MEIWPRESSKKRTQEALRPMLLCVTLCPPITTSQKKQWKSNSCIKPIGEEGLSAKTLFETLFSLSNSGQIDSSFRQNDTHKKTLNSTTHLLSTSDRRTINGSHDIENLSNELNELLLTSNDVIRTLSPSWGSYGNKENRKHYYLVKKKQHLDWLHIPVSTRRCFDAVTTLLKLSTAKRRRVLTGYTSHYCCYRHEAIIAELHAKFLFKQ